MTTREARVVIQRLMGAWQNFRPDGPAAEEWMRHLAPMDAGSAQEAVAATIRRGSAFAPSLAEFVLAVSVVEQGQPPTAEEMDRIIHRNASRWPYAGHYGNEERTVAAIEQLASRGVHEAVLRFVAQVGAFNAGMMPDGTRYALDRDQTIRQQQLFRSYRDEAVAGWRADPTPGRALEAARERLELAGAEEPTRIGRVLKRLGRGQ